MSRIDEIRAFVAAHAESDTGYLPASDGQYLLDRLALAEKALEAAEARLRRIADRECELSRQPGVYECRVHDGHRGCLGCQLRDAEARAEAAETGREIHLRMYETACERTEKAERERDEARAELARRNSDSDSDSLQGLAISPPLDVDP